MRSSRRWYALVLLRESAHVAPPRRGRGFSQRVLLDETELFALMSGRVQRAGRSTCWRHFLRQKLAAGPDRPRPPVGRFRAGPADRERRSGHFLYRSERARAKDGSDHVMGWSYLNSAAHALQMIPESQGRCFLALSKVSIKLNLVAQGDASTHEFGLTPFSFADRLCEREDIRSGSRWNEKHPIVIGQDEILPIHRPVCHGGTFQRAVRTWIEPLRTGWDRSEAEDRQPNRSYVSRITMQAPDHDAFESSPVALKDNKIAYAAFVEPSAVVDHQHVARSSPLQRLKENVDAASVSSGDYTPREAASWNNCVQERGGAAHWGLSTDARIR